MASANQSDQVEDVEMSLPSHTVTSSLEVTGVTSYSPANPGGPASVPGDVTSDVEPQADQVPSAAEGQPSALIEQWALRMESRVSAVETAVRNLQGLSEEARGAIQALGIEVRPEVMAHKMTDHVARLVQDRVMPLVQRIMTLEQGLDTSTAKLSSMQISQAAEAVDAPRASMAAPAPQDDDDDDEEEDEVPTQPPSRSSKKKLSRTKSRRERENEDPSSSDPDPSDSSSSHYSDSGSSSNSSSRRRSSRYRRGRRRRRQRRRRSHQPSETRNVNKETKSLGRDDEELILGPSHEGLTVLTSTNPRYRKLMNYRYYRLNRTKQERSSREVGKVTSKASKMETAIGSKFSGSDPVRIFSALRDIVQEANNNDLTEGQLFLAVPRLLTGNAKTHFESSRDGSRRGAESIASWPETVNFLLTAYATPRAISDAIKDLREVCQEKNETESAFSDRVNAAMSRCGGVHTSEEKSTHFVEHLRPEISPLVAQYREEKQEATYFELVRYASTIGEAERARSSSRRELKTKVSSSKKKKESSGRNLILQEDRTSKSSGSATSASASASTDSRAIHVNIAGTADGSSSDDEGGSTGSSSTEEEEEDEVLATETRYVPAGRVAFDNNPRRGWPDHGPPRGGPQPRHRDRGNGRDKSPPPPVVKLLPHFVLLALTTVDKHVQRYVTPAMRWGTIHLAVSCRSIRI